MQISIYYQKEDRYLLDKVKKLAQIERRSKSSALISILEQYFESDRKLGELLKDMNAINTSQLHRAIDIQRNEKEDRRLGEIMLEEGFVNESQLDRALGVQHSLNNGGAKRSFAKSS